MQSNHIPVLIVKLAEMKLSYLIVKIMTIVLALFVTTVAIYQFAVIYGVIGGSAGIFAGLAVILKLLLLMLNSVSQV